MNFAVLKKNKSIYFFNIFLLCFSTTLPHAILTILFLDKRLNMSEIIFMQSLFNLSMIIFEIPSGVISDIYSRKKVYLSCLTLLVITFLIILTSENFYYLSLGYIIYGMSNALETGTLEAYFITGYKNDDNMLQSFLKLNKQISLFSSILGAGLGSVLYFKIGVNIYRISIIFLLFDIILISFFFVEERKKNGKNFEKINKITFKDLKKHLNESFYELKKNKIIRYYILFFGIIQIFIQSHYQLWQQNFLIKNINKSYFFYVYLLFQIITIIAHSVDILKINYRKIYFFMIIQLLLLFLIKFNNIRTIFIISYFLLCSIMFVINYYFYFHFNKKVSVERISSITSILSTLSRIFSFFILLFSSFLLKKINSINLFVINILFMFLILFYILQKIKKYEKNSSPEV